MGVGASAGSGAKPASLPAKIGGRAPYASGAAFDSASAGWRAGMFSRAGRSGWLSVWMSPLF
ncbi:hypothetical protein GCM10008020_14850 [Massilia psychrophila]|nr:hypothetical protein GCM10008020_14850 [Massilia psychrophila]